MTNIENVLLLGCLVRFEQLLKEADDKCKTYMLFDNLKDPASAMIWETLRATYGRLKQMPPKTMLATDLVAYFEVSKLSQDMKDTVQGYFQNMCGMQDLTLEVGRMYLQTALYEAFRVGWRDKMKYINDMDELKQFSKNVGQDIIAIAKREGVKNKPLAHPERFLVYKERTPLGIKFWDTLLAGGVAGGEVIGLLGPTGGGKTVLSIMASCEQALRRKHVLYVTYEEKLEGDIAERIYGYMTQMSVNKFRDKNYDVISDEDKAALADINTKYGQYLTVLDLAQQNHGCGGAAEVIGHIQESINAGEKPTLIVLDWLGSMVNRYIAANSVQGENPFRGVAKQFLSELNAFAKDNNIAILIVHQLSTKTARQSPKTEPKVTDADEFKSFSYYMDACFCLGTMSKKEKVAWFIGDKQRRGPMDKCLIKLDGEHCKFHEAKNYITDQKGQFVNLDAAPPDVDNMLADERVRESYPVRESLDNM